VLILGETGTGKELICRAIHHASLRRDRPLVKLNCAAIPSGLIESELFGHEKGAFTGAIQQKRGRFELAHEGTIFLDEIGDIPLETQPKLLRLLQEQEFERVGGNVTIDVDVRVIAATHRDLERMVADGDFREDLFYRLNVFPIPIPPLRQRREDIPVLARYFAHRKSTRHGDRAAEFTEAAIDRLCSYRWPGNIRELENIIERAVILCDGELIDVVHIHVDDVGAAAPTEDEVRPLQEVERDHIVAAVKASGGKISGPGGAAQMLGLKPSTLESRMKKLGVERQKAAG
jgi:transcriptional regulator with GAF, ATPase, and Fis domain